MSSSRLSYHTSDACNASQLIASCMPSSAQPQASWEADLPMQEDSVPIQNIVALEVVQE